MQKKHHKHMERKFHKEASEASASDVMSFSSYSSSSISHKLRGFNAATVSVPYSQVRSYYKANVIHFSFTFATSIPAQFVIWKCFPRTVRCYHNDHV